MSKILMCLIFIIMIFTINVSAKDTSSSSIIIDNNTGRILYENNIHEKKLIASTTKIMTAILAIENTDKNKIVKVGNEILDMYGTNIYIEVGEQIKIEDLIYGLLLRSGNDAAKTLAINTAGTEEDFVKMMNRKAKEIGMNNTTFENPHGLDDSTKNYSTAYDMALLSQYVSKNKMYMRISGTKKHSAKTKNKSYLWYNRNKLLNTYEYCTGGKNGYTPAAGKTLITTAEKGGLNLTAVTLNDPNIYETHKFLYENVYNKYKNYKIVDKKAFKLNNSVYKGKTYLKNSFIYPLTKSERERIKTKVIFFNEKEVEDIVGYIQIKLDNKIIGQVNIYKVKEKEGKQCSFYTKCKDYLLDTLKKLKLGLQKSLKPGFVVPIPLETYKSVSSIL